jgi:hypothetical protein
MKGPAVTDVQSALARLDDYVRGHDGDDAAHEYEEALFGRALAGNAPEADFHASLGSTLRFMDARGSLELWLTGRDVERVRASGLKTVLYEYTKNLELPEIPPGTDLLITRVPLPLEGVRSIEAEVYANDGRLLKRMPDVLFDPADGAVFACCEAELARAAASNTQRTVTKVWVVTDTERRLLAEL